jgi:hypothetical protein
MPNNQQHSIPATKLTPALKWSISGSEISLSLKGSTEMEDVVAWYAPIFAWLESVLAHTYREIPFALTLQLNYVNTSSSKALLDLLDRLREEYESTERSIHAVYVVDEGDEDIESAARELFADWKIERYTIRWSE